MAATPTGPSIASLPLDAPLTCYLRGTDGNSQCTKLEGFKKYCDAKFDDDTSTRVLYKEGANRFHLNIRIVKDGWVARVEADGGGASGRDGNGGQREHRGHGEAGDGGRAEGQGTSGSADGARASPSVAQSTQSAEKEYTPVVDPERTQLRLQKAIRLAEFEAAKIGTNVSEEAQGIFNVISKTLPCAWAGRTIVVMDEVEIREPYEEVCGRGEGGHQRDALVERVGKLLAEAKKGCA